ncbi:MAG: nickel responsive regulator [Candidatus Altiarchaeales archaeon A3]|nr:MAG: nickel responsive regulator [Candidatus Altiarchaeales archaeon A3]
MEIERASISLPKLLLEKFDELIIKKGYANRSEAFRDLIRNLLIEEEWNENAEIVATVTLIYNHHASNLLDKLTDIEHEGIGKIISTMHIHIDAENCLEVICLKGNASDVKQTGDKLISLKGIKYGKIVKATTGKEID